MKRLRDVSPKRPHILFFITSLRYGGAERVVVNLSAALAGTGRYRVTIMLLEGGVDYPIASGVEVARLHYGHRDILSKTHSLIQDPFIIKDFVENHGVDVILSFMQRPNVINLLARALGSNHFSYVNVRVCLTKQYGEISLVLKLIGRLFLKWLWRYADRTIVNSYVIKDEIMTFFGINAEKVEVIYNPLNLKEIEMLSQEAVAEEWFREKETPIIINVGRLTKQKGHTHLLRSVALIAKKRPIRLVIIGDGELREQLVKEARRLGISDKVLFMGWQGNPYKYIARSSVFALSSLWEGFPNAILEAMACRCPVVVTDCLSGPSEILLPDRGRQSDAIIQTRYGVLVTDPREPNFSKAIEYMLDNKEDVKRYSDAGFERVTQFNISKIIHRYEEMISDNVRPEAAFYAWETGKG